MKKIKKQNDWFSIFIFVCFVLFTVALILFDWKYGVHTPPQVQQQQITGIDQSPITISPSNVRIVTPTRTRNYNIPLTSRGTINRNGTPRPAYVFTKTREDFRSEGEMLCCKIFEEYIGGPVEVNIREDFLKNPETGRNLELDCFYRAKKIAIEYNGSYHYKKVRAFGNDPNKVHKRDEIKIRLCKKAGIRLIVVPYTVDSGKLVEDEDGNQVWKEVKVPREERERRLRQYIEPYLNSFLSG